MTLQTLKIQHVVDTVETWSLPEQLELIQAIAKLLQRVYTFNGSDQTRVTRIQTQLPDQLHHAPPIMDIGSLVASFWPQDESADEINTWIYQQRQEDLQREL